MVKQKKTMKMKKIYIGLTIAIMIVTTLALSLIGCGPKASYTVGTVQVAPHPALDAAYNGFKDELTRLMTEKGETVKFEIGNADGDFSNNATIATNYANKGVDLIYALGTPSATAAKIATTTIPVIFNAVTDPLDPTAALVKNANAPEGNVTGCSDAAPIEKQIDLLVRLMPESKVVGVLYNKDESNSVVQINQVKAYCATKGITVVEQAIVNNDITLINNAFTSFQAKDVTGIYLPTDNLLANNIESFMNANKDLIKVPVVCAETGMTEKGGIATYGLSYYNLGKIAGQMAFDILYNKKPISEIPVQRMEKFEDFDKFLSEENAAKIGYTIPQDILDEFKPAA